MSIRFAPSARIPSFSEPIVASVVGLPRPLISVGRLDFNTEGLLLLTSCGHLARELEHPRNSIRRVYHVLVHGNLTHKTVTALRRGITVDGEKFRPMEVSVLDQSSERKWWLEVTLREGKYREVRRLLSVFGLTVNRLVRHAYGPYTRIPHRGGVMRRRRIAAWLRQAVWSAAVR